MNRHFVDDSVMLSTGVPLDYHELPPIKAVFGMSNPIGLEVNEVDYEDYLQAVAEFRDKHKVGVDE